MSKLEKFLKEIREEIANNPVARKMGYEKRLGEKIDKLIYYFPFKPPQLFNLFREILFNVSIKDSDLTNVLKFLDKLEKKKRQNLNRLFALIWQDLDPKLKQTGLSEDKDSRDELKRELFSKIDVIRLCSKKIQFKKLEIKRVIKLRKILSFLSLLDILKILNISPHILKGLRKTPRPIYSWILPVLVNIALIYILLNIKADISIFKLYLFSVAFISTGIYLISTSLKIAPGILYYSKTKDFLLRVTKAKSEGSKLSLKMKKLGLNLNEIKEQIIYENKNRCVKIILRDKNSLEGAVRFLTSSDEIGSCTALENFVSWTLPSLLNDDGIFLAEVYHKGKRGYFSQRAQIWMVASAEDNIPLLVINSFEFNNDGAEHINELMPEMVRFIKDIAKRVGFKKIYVGISTFAREYLDKHFKQGAEEKIVVKLHDPELGYKYYFDAFKLSYNWKLKKREFIYLKKRNILKRSYAFLFGIIEFLKGNTKKARAFFDTVKNSNNFWEIPICS